MAKWGSIGVIMALLCMGCCCAFAEGPIDPYFASSQPVALPFRSRSAAKEIHIPASIDTGVPVSFTIDAEAFKYYFSLLSPVQPGSNTYQYIYIDHYGSSNPSFEYVFYYPGNYWIRVTTEDEKGKKEEKSAYFVVQGENLLTKKINEIVSACPNGGEYDKVLFLHDYLIHHSYYDSNLTRYYADGVLMDGYGVCDSYSKAFDLLLSAAGIQSRRITSSTHSWNAVEIEGEWYNIDVTWDDPIYLPVPISGKECHHYFGLPNRLLFQLDHHHPVSSYPDCQSITYNYAIQKNQLPWHNALVSSILEKMNGYESTFTLELERIYRIEPAVSYGLSAMLLEKNGMVYRTHPLELIIGDDHLADYLLDFEIHYAKNTDEILSISAAEIRKEAFSGCGAARVMLDEKCTKIKRLAFAHMPNLKEIYIPKSVLSIERKAFAGCDPDLLIITEEESAAVDYAKQNGFCLEITPSKQ